MFISQKQLQIQQQVVTVRSFFFSDSLRELIF